MSFDFSKGLASLQGTVSDLGQSITPFAKRTRQMINERLGHAEEITALPDEYLELEQRLDALKEVHQKLLGVLSVYDHEGYDYPPNLRETLTETARSVHERVTTAAQATSAQEAGHILVGSSAPGEKREPRTLHHALGRAMTRSAAHLDGQSLPSLQTALSELGTTELSVGDARLAQDREVQAVNASLHNTLENSLQFALKARKNVHSARLNLDAAKAAAKGNVEGDSDVEKAEDEFVASIEEAVAVMRNVLDTPEPVRDMVKLANAQLAFHKQAAEKFAEITPQLEKLQEQQETAYREARS